MWKYLRDFWRDDRGCAAATYWMFVASILTLGSIAGISALHHLVDKRPDESPPTRTR
jgi:Flp pilus assembly pilin Flp